MRANVLILILGFVMPIALPAAAQNVPGVPDGRDSTATRTADTTTVQDALYTRPFIGTVSRTSIGGYVEGNTNYFVEDGISDGFSMELRRFNVFVFSSIGSRIRLISEIEFEHGTEEIALETALIDVRINPALVVRAGILLPPIGSFNQNHDAPLWEFVDRPIVSTEILPATLSEVGFGVYGKWFRGPLAFTYDFYVTNGLGDGVIGNDIGRTRLASGKHEGLFEEDNNGSPAFSGRVAVAHRAFAEVGASFYTGYYNTYRAEGERIDEPRRLTLVALDFEADAGLADLRGEFAFAAVDVQEDLAEIFGERQWGGHLDVVVPVWRPRIAAFEAAVLNVNLRAEIADFNVGTFDSTGENVFDQLYAVVPGISFRPSPGTVFRANYRHQWYRDLVGNAAVRTAGFQFGFATYF